MKQNILRREVFIAGLLHETVFSGFDFGDGADLTNFRAEVTCQ